MKDAYNKWSRLRRDWANIWRGVTGPYDMSPGSTANKKQQSFFKYFLPAQKEMTKVWFQNYLHETKFADTCHLFITDSLFYPRGKKALIFSLNTDTFMAPRGPSVSVVIMGGVRWGVYSRTAILQGGAYFKITFLTIWNGLPLLS